MKNSFFIKSLGCKTNQIEGQLIAQDLTDSGFTQIETPENCDFYILNTCSVTSHADNQAVYLVKQFRAKNPDAKVILTGCQVQTSNNKNSLNADLILGNNEKLEISKYLKDFLETSGEKQVFAEDIFKIKKFKHKNLCALKTTRPSIKIQEGCSNRCSYCIIPFARGNSRSDTLENILEQINFLAQNGYKEVVLTGIHIGEWGIEFNKSLKDLILEIEKTDILRFRLGSLYVTELNNDFIDTLSECKKFCPHFHLSLQSMCDKTLKNMNRFYTKDFALNVIQKLHEKFNLPYLGCDIITGFPLETEQDFLETYNALKEAQLSYIHSFPYSVRPKTKASTMPQVYEHVKKERTKELMALSNELHKNFLEKNRNTLQEVLFQRKNKKTGCFAGLTRNYIKVYKKSEKDLWNTVETLCLKDFTIE